MARSLGDRARGAVNVNSPSVAPTVERFTARLAALSRVELLDFAARGCHESADIRRDADALLAIRTPTSDKALNKVLLSPDLVPEIFSSLEVEDHAAALVCKAWGVGWKARTRRILQPAPCPAPDFELKWPRVLAALPGGEEMAILSSGPPRVIIVDKEMKWQRTLGHTASGVTFPNAHALVAGDDGLYVSEAGVSEQPRLQRLQLDKDTDTFAVAAEYTSDEHYGFYQLALAPGGVLFVCAKRRRDPTYELLALDALSLQMRFKVGKDVLGADELSGLAVCGDELYVGNQHEPSIHVFSLSGKPRRVISSQPGGWRTPSELCCVADRLYLTEAGEYPRDEDEEEEARAKRLTQRRVFVLTPEGRTLQVYASPRPLEESVRWRGMCHFDGKLRVADMEQHEVLALQGL